MRREQDWGRNLGKPKFKQHVEQEGKRAPREAGQKHGVEARSSTRM